MIGLSLEAWPWLLLLVLVPLGWAWAARRRLRLPLSGAGAAAEASEGERGPLEGAPPAARSPDPEAGGPLPPPRPASRLWWWWTPGLRSAALAAVVLGIAGPVRTLERVERRSEGAAIVLAFDVSSSMLAEDFRPQNRIGVARRQVARFVAGRPADRIGLVAFASEALTVVPGTLDHDLLLQAVGELDVGQLEDGTAIGTALAAAANRVRDFEGSRVVVLLTDGENNRGRIDPREAAAAAAALGIRVYTIGVGRDGVAPVPIGRSRFGLQYAEMEVTVDDALLTDLAEATGGIYFRATDPAGLARIVERIDRLERAPVREVRIEERRGTRPLWAWLALGLLLLELAGGAGRARRSLAP